MGWVFTKIFGFENKVLWLAVFVQLCARIVFFLDHLCLTRGFSEIELVTMLQLQKEPFIKSSVKQKNIPKFCNGFQLPQLLGNLVELV